MDYVDPKEYSWQTCQVVQKLDHTKINYDLIEKLLLSLTAKDKADGTPKNVPPN